MPAFDCYVMVDWSAAAVPRTGRDSIWIARLRHGAGGVAPTDLDNPPTRDAATERLTDLLAALIGEGRRVLVGFDFPFGFPSGTAACLGLPPPAWRATWARLAALIEDRPDNDNNRFDVGEQLNRRISGEAFPFWGHNGTERPYLKRRGRRPHGPGDLAERRLCERRVPRAQPVWKLAYAGAVGSQTLTGIPRVWQLREDTRLCEQARIWPFETGLRDDPSAKLVLAEVYPSVVAPKPLAGLPKDAGQVAALAEHFAGLDKAGQLAPLFAGDPELTTEERRRVEDEEAWILGVPAPKATFGRASMTPEFDYLRDPDAITAASFAAIRREVDLEGLPAELHDIALRIVHAAGQPELAGRLAWSDGAVAAGRAALGAGADLLVDAEMVAQGIQRRRLTAGNAVRCLLNAEGVAERAAARGMTRSAAAVEAWRPWLGGAVVAIGNAPTALFRLLELLAEGWPRPALILGFPVGFVGAAESKQALIAAAGGVPYVTLRGRLGGSAIAAAAVNALAGGQP